MDAEQEYYRLKMKSECVWTLYLDLAQRDWDEVMKELDSICRIADFVGLKKASAAISCLITKTNNDIQERAMGL